MRQRLTTLGLITMLGLATGSSQGQTGKGNAFTEWRNKPAERFDDGQAMFELVKKTLEERYVDAGLTEDDIYKAAVEGMLSNIDPKMKEWNRLMSPSEYAELIADTQGKVVGVGVMISFDEVTGYISVLEVIAGTPAARAGIVRGDQILKINGVSFRGKQMRDVVYAIRGEVGTQASLTILHDETIRTETVTREALVWDTVSVEKLDDGVARVAIHRFTEKTPALLKAALESLKTPDTKGLIVDLRCNEGGLFDRAIDSLKMLVPNGATMVTVKKRDGAEDVMKNDRDPILSDLPMTVLINGETKSGAEIVAAALKHGNDATVIGAKSFGKWSAQRVEELPNRYAMRFTTATFIAADGRDLSGIGLEPDIDVVFDPAEFEKLQANKNAADRFAADPQMQSALSVLRMRD